MQQFIQCVGGSSSLYGLCEETLDSLLLTVLPLESKLPTTDTNKTPFQQLSFVDSFEHAHQKQICIMQVLTEALKLNFNLHYQQVCDQISILFVNLKLLLFFSDSFSVLQKNWSVIQHICSI